MANVTVSSAVDTMLQSANNSAILTNTGAAPTESPTFTGTGITPIQFGTVGPPFASDGHTRFTDGIRVDNSSIEALLTGTATGGAVTGQDLEIRGGSTGGDGSTAGDLILAGGRALQVAGQTVTHGKIKIGDQYTNGVELNGVTEIQCKGTTAGTAQPINYDSLEHRFRDYDETPSNLMVIKKIAGKNGARVGINVPASQNPKSALHVAYGGSTDGISREALRVTGGAFFNEWVRVGHFTDTTRDAISNPTNGTIIYNEDHHEFQGYIGGAQGTNSRWQAFTMQNVAT